MTMNTNETAMEISKNFIFPDMAPTNGFSTEDIGDDFDGLRLSFQRIKIPSGGTLQFEVPGDDPENPDYTKNIIGIIIYNHDSNAYWPLGMEYDENTTPFCTSFDGKTGYGIPGGVCALCEMNQFGTVENGGKGKACKNTRTLYILRSGDVMPIQLSLPPTSLSAYTEFINASFARRQRPTWASIVEIGLKKGTNGTNIFSVATFKRVADLDAEQISRFKPYSDNFRAQIKEMLNLRTLEAQNRSDVENVTDLESNYAIEGNGEHFAITNGNNTPENNGAVAADNNDAFINSGAGDLPFPE